MSLTEAPVSAPDRCRFLPHSLHPLISPLPHPTPNHPAHTCALQWIHSLHPDAFLLLESDHEGSSPFLIPRIRECFDFHSHILHCHDSLSTREAASGNSGSQPPHVDTESHPDVDPASSPEERRTASESEKLLGSFKVPLPRKRLQARAVTSSGDGSGQLARRFQRRAKRSCLLTCENFYFGRNILNIIALEGMDRFRRPYSGDNWSRRLRALGFKRAPFIKTVQGKVYEYAQCFPSGFVLETTDDCMRQSWRGGPMSYASIWCS